MGQLQLQEEKADKKNLALNHLEVIDSEISELLNIINKESYLKTELDYIKNHINKVKNYIYKGLYQV